MSVSNCSLLMRTGLMEEFDRESFDLRADFWGRTLEEELVLSLDGPRANEAFARLRQLASVRRVHVDQIVSEVHASRAAYSESHVTDTSRCEPKVIYSAGECPICTEGSNLGALACGHVICYPCYLRMQEYHVLNTADGPFCPHCRKTSNMFWSFEA